MVILMYVLLFLRYSIQSSQDRNAMQSMTKSSNQYSWVEYPRSNQLDLQDLLLVFRVLLGWRIFAIVSKLSSVGAVWHPLGAGAGSRLLQHAVNLLEGKTLGLRNEEVGVDEAEEAERAPKEENLGSEVDTTSFGGGHVWGNDSNDLKIR